MKERCRKVIGFVAFCFFSIEQVIDVNAAPSSMMVTFHKEEACSGLGPNQGLQSKERLKKSQLTWAILIQFDNSRLLFYLVERLCFV